MGRLKLAILAISIFVGFLFVNYCLLISMNEIDLGNGYVLYLLEKENTYIVSKSGIATPFNIVGYDSDSQFIIAEQIPIKPDTDEEISKLSTNIDSFYKHGLNVSYYWIIDKRKNILHGPYDYNEYILSRKKLHVTVDLEIERIH
jgi:hypothetical protein